MRDDEVPGPLTPASPSGAAICPRISRRDTSREPHNYPALGRIEMRRGACGRHPDTVPTPER